MNTDVNLCRLPDEVHILAEILSAPYRRMRYPQTTDSATCQSKATERQFIIKENIRLRTAGISKKLKQMLFIRKNFSY